MRPDLYGALAVIALMIVWAAILAVLPPPCPRVELVDREDGEA